MRRTGQNRERAGPRAGVRCRRQPPAAIAGTLSALYAPVSGTCEVVATSSRVGSGVPPLEGTVTVINAVPLWPSLVAVIVAVPTTTPVTRPVALTLATLGALLPHVTVRPVSGLPFASRGVAVSCAVCPV